MRTPSDLTEFYADLRATGLVTRLLELARDEDLGPQGRDISSAIFIPASARLRCGVVARSGGVLAGLAVVPDLLAVFGIEQRLYFESRSADGRGVAPGETVAVLEGEARAILAVERTLLNTVGRLSGVASLTARFVEAMGTGHAAVLCDTRKTTPGLRVLEKYAVRCGGGHSHRLGLYDAVLIKDNHLAGLGSRGLAESLRAGIDRARAEGPQFLEVEVDGLAQFEEVLSLAAGAVDIVLLDNFATADLRRAVRLRDERRPGLALEASGGVTLETVAAIAATGVDRISAGALTHAAVGLDFGLDAL